MQRVVRKEGIYHDAEVRNVHARLFFLPSREGMLADVGVVIARIAGDLFTKE